MRLGLSLNRIESPMELVLFLQQNGIELSWADACEYSPLPDNCPVIHLPKVSEQQGEPAGEDFQAPKMFGKGKKGKSGKEKSGKKGLSGKPQFGKAQFRKG